MATSGCDGHAVNDTTLAHGQLRWSTIPSGRPTQATGKDQTPFNRPGSTPPSSGRPRSTPLKPEGPQSSRPHQSVRGLAPNPDHETLHDCPDRWRRLMPLAAWLLPQRLPPPNPCPPRPSVPASNCGPNTRRYREDREGSQQGRAQGLPHPIVCPRVYKQVAPRLDPNRNKVACEPADVRIPWWWARAPVRRQRPPRMFPRRAQR